jgi:hypothetical protein
LQICKEIHLRLQAFGRRSSPRVYAANGAINEVTVSGNEASQDAGGIGNDTTSRTDTIAVDIAKVTGNTAPTFANYENVPVPQ